MGYFNHESVVIKGYSRTNWWAESDSYNYYYYIIFNDQDNVVKEYPFNGNPYNLVSDYNTIVSKLAPMGASTAASGDDTSLFNSLPSNKTYKIMIFFGNIEANYDEYGDIISYYWSYQVGNGMEYTAYVTLRDYSPFYPKFPDSGTITMLNVAQAYPFLSTPTYQVGNPGTVQMDCLIVAGGGAGGAYMPGNWGAGGGGGGGGVKTVSGLVSFANFSIQVGAGGTSGSNGGNSIAFGQIIYGGGAGGIYSSLNGKNGGSGGGGFGISFGGVFVGTGGLGTTGQGQNGGNGSGNENYSGASGGGGGAGGAGQNSDGTYPGNGGAAISSDISGTTEWYGGGGAGGPGYNGNGAYGGRNAGSSAGSASLYNAADGAGGGGAGGVSAYGVTDGGHGGSGVVIIRYQGNQKYSGGAVSRVGSYTIHTFRSSGQFNALPDYTPLYATYIDLNNNYVRSAFGKKGSGTAITLNDGHGKQAFNLVDQNINIPNAIGFAGCAGVGYEGAYLSVTHQYGVYLYLPTVYNYYSKYTYPGRSGKYGWAAWDPWFYIGAWSDLSLNSNGRFAINDSTEYIFPRIARPFYAAIFGQGDWTALRVCAYVDNFRWVAYGQCPIRIIIDRDCKGGTGDGAEGDGDGIAWYYNFNREIAASSYLTLDL